jgi:membrane-associated phospholipid phosphatase
VTTTGPDSQPTAPPRRAHQVADAVSIASDFGALWVAVSVVQVLVGRASVVTAVRRLGAAGITSLVLTRLLKHYFAVPRPDPDSDATVARTPSSSGFPSGHTLAAFVSAVLLPRTRRGRVLALLVASLVGWARVEVGHHRVADVLAGAAAGTTAGAALAVIVP